MCLFVRVISCCACAWWSFVCVLDGLRVCLFDLCLWLVFYVFECSFGWFCVCWYGRVCACFVFVCLRMCVIAFFVCVVCLFVCLLDCCVCLFACFVTLIV